MAKSDGKKWRPKVMSKSDIQKLRPKVTTKKDNQKIGIGPNICTRQEIKCLP